MILVIAPWVGLSKGAMTLEGAECVVVDGAAAASAVGVTCEVAVRVAVLRLAILSTVAKELHKGVPELTKKQYIPAH